MAMAALLADDWGDHMGRGWWWVMGVGWLVFLSLVVWLVYLLVRHVTTSPVGSVGREAEASERARAEAVLAERFARGDIDEDEYRRRRAVLRE